MRPKTEVPDLTSDIETLSKLCRNRDWTTADPLGVGGLLFDACRLSQLIGAHADQELLEQLRDASEKGIEAFLGSRPLLRPPSQRLAFRELGLAIGLKALPTIIGRAHRTRNDHLIPCRRDRQRLAAARALT